MLKHHQITEQIIQAYYQVFNTLGYGFLEKVYQNAMVIELRTVAIGSNPRPDWMCVMPVKCVGEYYADLLVEGLVIVEMKAADGLATEHHLPATYQLPESQRN